MTRGKKKAYIKHSKLQRNLLASNMIDGLFLSLQTHILPTHNWYIFFISCKKQGTIHFAVN